MGSGRDLRLLLLFLRRGFGRGFAGVWFRDGKENLEAHAVAPGCESN